MLAKRKQAANEYGCSAPFRVLTRVPELGDDIRRDVTAVNLPRPFDVNAIAIVPREVAALPVEIGTVSVREQQPPRRRQTNNYVGSKRSVGGSTGVGR